MLLTCVCLIYMLCKGGATSHESTFSRVSKRYVPTKCILCVKHLTMALVETLAGSIDQVLQQVTMTWVQPRVLDKDQVNCVCTCLGEFYILC